MALPDGFDFLVRDEFAAPGLPKPFADGSPCFLIERHDWGLLGHRQHGNRNGILVFRRKLARPFDRLFKQLRHGHHRIIFVSCREAAKATGAPGRTRTSTTLRPPDFESRRSYWKSLASLVFFSARLCMWKSVFKNEPNLVFAAYTNMHSAQPHPRP